MAQAMAVQGKEKELVFEKVQFDPLSNPEVFGFEGTNASSPIDVDSGWESDEKKQSSTTHNPSTINTNTNTNTNATATSKSTAPVDSTTNPNETDEEMKGDSEQNANDEPDYESIEDKLQRSKKKKKVDFRAEMTSDSQDIDDLLMFQSKERNEKEELTQIDEELLLCFILHSVIESVTVILAQCVWSQ